MTEQLQYQSGFIITSQPKRCREHCRLGKTHLRSALMGYMQSN